MINGLKAKQLELEQQLHAANWTANDHAQQVMDLKSESNRKDFRIKELSDYVDSKNEKIVLLQKGMLLHSTGLS